MSDFKIQKESRQPDYGLSGVMTEKSSVNNACGLVLGLLSMVAFNGCSMMIPTGGEPAMNLIESKQELVELTEAKFASRYNIDFERDILVCMTNSNQIISFRADGLDTNSGIIYEWVTAEAYFPISNPDYQNPTDPDIVIDSGDGDLPVNQLLGINSNYIMVLDVMDEVRLYSVIDSIMYDYNSDNETN